MIRTEFENFCFYYCFIQKKDFSIFFIYSLGEAIQKSNMGLSKKTAVKTLRQNALTLATLGGVLVGIILGKFVYNLS